MAKKQSGKRVPRVPKTVLWLPDLDQAKSAVLNSLSSADAQRRNRHAIDQFSEWHCSEPRLSFSRSVVLRDRYSLVSIQTTERYLGCKQRIQSAVDDRIASSPKAGSGTRTMSGCSAASQGGLVASATYDL